MIVLNFDVFNGLRNVMRSSWQKRQKRPTCCTKLILFCILTLTTTISLVIFFNHELSTKKVIKQQQAENPTQIEDYSRLSNIKLRENFLQDLPLIEENDYNVVDIVDDYSQEFREFKPENVYTNEQLRIISESQEYREDFLFTSKFLMQKKDLTFELSSNNQLPYEINCNKSAIATSNNEFDKQLFIVVNSAIWNIARRARMRSSWLSKKHVYKQVCLRPGNKISKIRIIFAVASQKTTFATRSQSEILNENQSTKSTSLLQLNNPEIESKTMRDFEQREQDLLSINLIESYKSLSVKHLAIIKWLVEFYAKSKSRIKTNDDFIVLKCDDDSEIDLNQLLNMYDRLSHASHVRFREPKMMKLLRNSSQDMLLDLSEDANWFMCATFDEGTRVLRNFNGNFNGNFNSKFQQKNGRYKHKWSLSRQEFSYDTFPQYCSGLAYLAPLKTLERLLVVAWLNRSEKRPLWVDDAYVTGVLSGSLANKIKFIPLNGYFCYSRAQRTHRLQLGINCMASELGDHEQPSKWIQTV